MRAAHIITGVEDRLMASICGVLLFLADFIHDRNDRNDRYANHTIKVTMSKGNHDDVQFRPSLLDELVS